TASVHTDFRYTHPASGDLPPAALLSRAGLIQRQLAVGPTDDAYEREADQVADTIMRKPLSDAHMPALSRISTNGVQRACTACEEEKIQPKREGSAADTTASPGVESGIQHSRGRGQSLGRSTRQFMESRFQTDFSSVNIHTSGAAQRMNRDLNARAFTVGQDIYFNRGEYQPETDSGKHLIAHELAHVVQQTGRIQRQDPASAAPPQPQPMSRADFETHMRDNYGVPIIRTGTEDMQKTDLGMGPSDSIPGWQSWDPGANSDVYQHIIDAFAQFNTAFQGFPEVNEINFFRMDYKMENNAPVELPGTGASFGTRDMNIYQATTTRMKGYPVARSNAQGNYPNAPVGQLSYGGDPNAAPIAIPSPAQTAIRIIIHELGHGIGVAAANPGFGSQPQTADRTLFIDYMNEVGWHTSSELFDIGVPAVATALSSNTQPDAQFRITGSNWNDPNWVEQPVSSYMVTGGPSEDFAEAITVFVENAQLLADRSPRRHAFITARMGAWQPQLRQPGPVPSLLPLLTVPPPTVSPFLLPMPTLGPDASMIDWGAMRGEITGRGAPWDDNMADSVEEAWMQSYRFYSGIGLGPDAAASWTNRTMPRLIGSALTNDYPTMLEASDREMDISTITLPVSDIVQFLIDPD
ncbi:MAG: DUF4157 domain-containing protein, partial [Bacteroidota bacterium]